MVWVADDLAAWLVEQLADAGRRRLTDLVLGDELERALQQAATAAVRAAAAELVPADGEQPEQLAMVISQVFAAPVPDAQSAGSSVLESLRQGVAAHAAVLEDRELTGTGRSSADVAGIGEGMLAPTLIRCLLAQIVSRGVRGGALFPLAAQLNADIARLEERQTQVMVRQLGAELLGAIRQVGQLREPTEARADAVFAIERDRYLTRLRQRYGRVDLEVLTPLAEQDEQPQILLRQVFVPQLVRADPPPVELPRELWRRLAEAGEADLPENLEREVVERALRQYQDRPAEPVLAVIGRPGAARMVVLGDPGAGKSTLARYMMLALAAACDTSAWAPIPVLAGLAGALPLLVELRMLSAEPWRDRTFLDLIDHLRETEDLGFSRPVLERYLRGGGSALVVFDGLDEIFDPAVREQVTRQIEAFADRYPQVRVIVTSRVVGYRRTILDGAGFAHWTLQDLDGREIESFTSAWYTASCPASPAEGARLRSRLLRAVADSSAIAELAGNPMLLTILAIIGRRRELPRERRLVYEHAVIVLIEHWDATGKHLHDSEMPYLSSEDKLELLRRVARRMQAGPAGLAGNHLPAADLRTEFEDYLRQRYELPASQAAPAARAMLDQLRERNFILALFGAGVYGFVHRAFLEYLAAADISERFAARDLSPDDLYAIFAGRWNDPSWHEVLVLITGMIPPRFTAAIITGLLRADPTWLAPIPTMPAHLLLALRCMGEARKPGELTIQARAITADLTLFLTIKGTEGLAGPDVSELLETFTSAALPVLSRLGPNWAGRPIFEDWYQASAQSAARGSGFNYGYGQQSVAYTAARMYLALLGQDSPDSYAIICRLAEEGPASSLRCAAVERLAAGWREDPATVALLRDRATTDKDWVVRQAAVKGLGAGPRDDLAIPALLRDLAATDPDEDVRHAAIQVLAAGWPGDTASLTLLRDLATADPRPNIRQAAMQALVGASHDDPATITLLRRCAAKDKNWTVRQAAIHALGTGSHDDPATLTLLRDLAATDPDQDVRQAAIQALAARSHGDPGTVSLLHDLAAADPHQDIRRAAVQALAAGSRSDPAAVVLLRDLAASDERWVVRQAAVRTLATRWPGDPGTLTLLHHRAATDDSRAVRRAAVETLAAGWGGDPATGTLLHALATTDENPTVRQAAAEGLSAGWPDAPGTMTLLRALATTDEDREVRQAATRVLAAGWRDDPATLTLLHNLAAEQSQHNRHAAIQILAGGWREDPATFTLLHDVAANDPDEDVRQAAVLALAAGWRDDPVTLTLLHHRAATDDSRAVRHAAIQILAGGWRDDPATFTLLHDVAASDPDEGVREAARLILDINASLT